MPICGLVTASSNASGSIVAWCNFLLSILEYLEAYTALFHGFLPWMNLWQDTSRQLIGPNNLSASK